MEIHLGARTKELLPPEHVDEKDESPVVEEELEYGLVSSIFRIISFYFRLRKFRLRVDCCRISE